MAVVPGFSVSDLIRAAAQLKLVYDSFFDDHDNAQSRVRELADAIDLFTINLINHKWILERSGRHYPGHAAFHRTLKECEDFIESYSILLNQKTNWTLHAWKKTRWAFEYEHIDKLRQQLTLHVQAMGGFTLNLLLRKAFHEDEDLSTSNSFSRSPTLTSGGLNSSQTELIQLYNEVQSIQNRHTRMESRTVQTGRRIDQGDFQSDLQNVLRKWREMLLRSGLTEEDLPRFSGERPLDLSEECWQRALNALLQSSNAPMLDGPLELAQIDPRSSISSSIAEDHPGPVSVSTSTFSSSPQSASFSPNPCHIPGQDVDTPLTTPLTGLSTQRMSSIPEYSLNLGLPTLEVCKAILTFSGKRVRIHDYQFRKFSGHRKVSCTTIKGGKIEHHLPPIRDSHPYTKHASLERPLEVSFLHNHLIVVPGRSKYRDDPHYTFTTSEDYSDFQSSIRDKKLLRSFEVDKISSRVSSDSGEASDQHLKLWRNFDNQQHSLTFFANNSTRSEGPCHREFPVAWFRHLTETGSDGHIRIEFQVQENVQQPLRRLSQLFGISSGDRRTTGDLSPPSSRPASMIASPPRALSIASYNSSSSETDKRHAKPDDEALRMKYLDVLFSSLEARDLFVVEFRKAHTASSTSKSPVMVQPLSLPELPKRP